MYWLLLLDNLSNRDSTQTTKLSHQDHKKNKISPPKQQIRLQNKQTRFHHHNYAEFNLFWILWRPFRNTYMMLFYFTKKRLWKRVFLVRLNKSVLKIRNSTKHWIKKRHFEVRFLKIHLFGNSRIWTSGPKWAEKIDNLLDQKFIILLFNWLTKLQRKIQLVQLKPKGTKNEMSLCLFIIICKSCQKFIVFIYNCTYNNWSQWFKMANNEFIAIIYWELNTGSQNPSDGQVWKHIMYLHLPTIKKNMTRL